MGNKSDKLSVIGEGDTVDWGNPRIKKLVVRDNPDGYQLEANVPVNNKQEFNKWMDSQHKNPASTSNFAFNPIKSKFKESGMCGSGGVATIDYDGYPYLLAQEIENRQKLEFGSFSEEDLWYLLYGISDVGQRFHRSGEKVGDICPKHILMNDDGGVKIVHQFSWPEEKTNYDKALYEK